MFTYIFNDKHNNINLPNQDQAILLLAVVCIGISTQIIQASSTQHQTALDLQSGTSV